MKTMKNLAAYLLLLTAVMFAASACSDDDKDKKEKPKEPDYSELVQGRWVVSQTRNTETDSWQQVTYSPTQLKFDSEGKCTVSTSKYSTNGTYKLDGKHINITWEGGDETYEIIQVNDNPKTLFVAVYSEGKTSGKKPNRYCRLSCCPSQPIEAWEMLKGDWEYLNDLSKYEYQSLIRSFTEDGYTKKIYYFPKNMPSTSTYYIYRGNYVYWYSSKVTVTPSAADPSKGTISYVENGKEKVINYSNLCHDMWTNDLEPANYARFNVPMTAHHAADFE